MLLYSQGGVGSNCKHHTLFALVPYPVGSFFLAESWVSDTTYLFTVPFLVSGFHIVLVRLFIPSPPGPQDLSRAGATTTSLLPFFSAFLIPVSLPCLGLVPRPSIQNNREARHIPKSRISLLFSCSLPFACSLLPSPLITWHPAGPCPHLTKAVSYRHFHPQLTPNNHFPGCLSCLPC